MLSSILVIVANAAVDLLQAWLDRAFRSGEMSALVQEHSPPGSTFPYRDFLYRDAIACYAPACAIRPFSSVF